MKAFRTLSFIEGCSLLILLFIAIPARQYFGFSDIVFYAGMTHGVLFLSYGACSLVVSHKQNWSVFQWLTVFLAGAVPFGFIFVDRKLKSDETPPQLMAETT